MSTHNIGLSEAILMSTHNIGLYESPRQGDSKEQPQHRFL